ncbi:hypothetical protein [Arthrobacter dokdonensis]|uniref:hypothetical protein n=1 Tax=Arthrobacter dokdonellae TaxID=2211210 RepID=UPI001013CC0F|nr:hypothetical protein [Arthrobacter dokdonellae]
MDTPVSLFDLKVPVNRAHPLFLAMCDYKGAAGARELMDLIFSNYIDEDKNFIKDFQSIGFSSRVWELSLFAYFSEADLNLLPTKGVVDYLVSNQKSIVAIEAVTSQPTGQVDRGVKTPSLSDVVPDNLPAARDEFIHQFGKALRKKWQKTNAAGQRYWELECVKGKPFVIAVESFHSGSSLFHSFGVAAEYLYGQSTVAQIDSKGQLSVVSEPIDEHLWNGKSIPSGIFNDPEWTDVSAVIFANGASVPQFNRIGKQEGLGDPGTVIWRRGTCANHNPNSATPSIFSYEVGTANAPEEDFAQAIHVFHNPNARRPLPPGFFPRASEHHRLPENGQILTTLGAEFIPFGSVTYIFQATDRKSEA